MARPAPMDLVIFINMCFPNDVTMMPRSKPHASGLFHDIMGKHNVCEDLGFSRALQVITCVHFRFK